MRAADAATPYLSLESRFDLACNAAYAAALAALRIHGYRSDSRYLVFQCLEHTLGYKPTNGYYWTGRITTAIWPNMKATLTSAPVLSTS